jgi:hypothetical protein
MSWRGSKQYGDLFTSFVYITLLFYLYTLFIRSFSTSVALSMEFGTIEMGNMLDHIIVPSAPP